MRSSDPVTGGSTLPTMTAHLQLLRKGERTKMHRHTSGTIYHAAEGGGVSTVGESEIEWQEGDTFVVPSWVPHDHRSVNGEAVLFSFTDRPIIEAFSFYREAPVNQVGSGKEIN